MTRPVSGVVMADLIASGKATPSQLEQVKENHRNNFNIWQKEHNAKQEYKRGMAIEFEKERRVNAGLPEYDVQESTPSQPLSKSEYRKMQAKKLRDKNAAKAENAEWKASVRKESAAKAKAARAKHNAETNPLANPKKVHKQLKQAEQLSPGSTAGINEKELLETLETNRATATAPTEFATKKTGVGVGTVSVKAEKAAEAAAESAGKTGSKVAAETAEAIVEGTGKASTGKVAAEGAELVAETATKSGSKFTKFLKKAGKWGAIALAVGGLLYGGYKLFFDKKDDKAQKVDTPKQDKPQADGKKPEDKTTPVKSGGNQNPAPVGDDNGKTKPSDPADGKDKTKVVPAPVGGDSDKADKADKSDKADKADKAEDKANKTLPKDYTVKKGDNVWNIAKKRLQELNGKKPTDREIMNYTKKLLEENKLEYEADGYTVIIHSGDKIRYAA